MLQATAWLARLALRISHAMSAGTSLAPDKKQKARLRGLLVLTWRRRRDSNSRYRFKPICFLSREVPSTTRPRLHLQPSIRQGFCKGLDDSFQRWFGQSQAFSRPNALCSARTANSMYFSSIKTEILISEVEII